MAIKGKNKDSLSLRVSKIQKQGNPNLSVGIPGDNIGLIFSGLTEDKVERGLVVTERSFGKTVQEFVVTLTMLPNSPIYRNGNKITLYINGVDVHNCEIVLPEGAAIQPGVVRSVQIKAPHYIVAVHNLVVSVRSGGRTIGTGTMVVPVD